MVTFVIAWIGITMAVAARGGPETPINWTEIGSVTLLFAVLLFALISTIYFGRLAILRSRPGDYNHAVVLLVGLLAIGSVGSVTGGDEVVEIFGVVVIASIALATALGAFAEFAPMRHASRLWRVYVVVGALISLTALVSTGILVGVVVLRAGYA